MALKSNITVDYRNVKHEKLKTLLVFIAFQFLMFYYRGNHGRRSSKGFEEAPKFFPKNDLKVA